jgi:oligopeptide/dipeptide ABC transporter ATP-binding protein
MSQGTRSAPPLLEVRRLAVRAKGLQVLRDVSVDVGAGECVAIVGETGSGKTATIRVIAGIAQRRGLEVTGGSVEFDGQDLLAFSPKEWKAIWGRNIALVPQTSLSSLDPVMKVGRQISETLRHLTPQHASTDDVLALLDRVHLRDPAGTAEMYPHQLSGGMRQRVAIALALAGAPRMILADEPTTALDVTVQYRILQLIRELQLAEGLAVLLVTHDLAVVEGVADRVAVLYGGMTLEFGPVRTVFDAPLSPYTQALLSTRPEGSAEGNRLTPIQGEPMTPQADPRGCPFVARCPHAAAQCEQTVPTLEALAGRQVACHRAAEWAA